MRTATILTLAACALLLAVLGPFGSYLGMSLPVRLLHYGVNIVVISAMVAGVSWLAARHVFRGPLPLAGSFAVAVALALPSAVVVRWHLTLFAPQVLPHVTFVELAMQIALINVLVTLGLRVVRLWVGRDGPEPPQPAPAAATPVPALEASVPAGNAVRERLPLHLRHARIHALSAEDHYLRVRTDRGEALVLLGLAQAIATLGEDAGVQIHRSHWVARDLLISGAARLSRSGLTLDGGPSLPVSRAGHRRLADGGFGLVRA